MPGFNAKMLDYKVQSGNSVVVMIGDQVVAFCQSADQGTDMGAEFLYGIGTAKPQEIQQLKFSPTLSVNNFVLTGHGIAILSYPSSILEVLANNSFDMHIINASGVPTLTYIGCVCNTYSQNIPVNSIITESIAFLAMDVLGPDGASILNGNFALQSITQLAGIALNTTGL